MARLIYCFLVFFLTIYHTVAQPQKWFEDKFDDRSKGWFWSDVNTPEISRSIEGGKYHIHHKNTMIYWTLNGFYNSPDRPFLLETNITQTEGAGGNGFGIIVSGRDGKYYYFIIDPAKEAYWVGTEQKGNWTTLSRKDGNPSWVVSEVVAYQGQNNNLKLQSADNSIRFLINDVEVFTAQTGSDFQEMKGACLFGIVTCTPMKIEVDDFAFYQDNPPINIVRDLPKVKKVNLGPNVNTRYIEKAQYIAPDGKTLYYVVQSDPENQGPDKGDDIYFSTLESDTVWGKRQNIGWPLNNDWPNAVLTATPDNNTLYLMHQYREDGYPKGSGFSITHKTPTGWSVPTDLKVKNYYNKGGSNEFCFSSDRKVLVMAVKRDDSFGDNDIYVSFLQEDGEFSEPKNLGKTVNTFAWETSPFLAPDGVTLYYSTAGYPGYGNNDIFMVQRLDSTWTNWSTPLNMGPDINSAEWDAYYTLAASGEYAFVASRNGGIEGSLDLFRMKLPRALRPNPVVLVYGKVMNSKTKTPLGSDINYNILSSNKEVGIASSNATTGSYKIVLPAGEIYSFLAQKEGFYSVSENIDVTKITQYKEIERDLYLSPIEVGEAIRLNNLFFDFNKSVLRKESFPELDRVITLLKNNPQMKIEIAGHTDNVGTDEVNNKLSNDRATAVKVYLETKGVQSDRISSRGYGKSKPVAPNTTDEGRQKNRRVEFTILTK